VNFYKFASVYIMFVLMVALAPCKSYC